MEIFRILEESNMRYVIIPEDDYNEIIYFISIISDFVKYIKIIPKKYRNDISSAYNKFYENSHYYEREIR